MNFRQITEFLQGMRSDTREGVQPNEAYRKAVNMKLVEDGDLMALTRLDSDTEVPTTGIPTFPITGHVVSAQFPCTFDYSAVSGSQEPREGILMFAYQSLLPDNGTYPLAIWIYDIEGDKYFRMYDDTLVDANARPGYARVSPFTIDCYIYTEHNQSWAIWTDGVHPIRTLKLKVRSADYTQFTDDLSTFAQSPDALLLQRLFVPGTPLAVNGLQGSGQMLSGSYQLAVRFYNSEFDVYSTWSWLSMPLPLFSLDDAATASTGLRIGGSGINQDTGRAVTGSFTTSHYHKDYYDRHQWMYVRWSDDSISEVAQGPVTDVGFSQGGGTLSSSYIFSDPSDYSTIDISDVVIESASIETANTIAESNGRLFIGGVKYKANTGGETITINNANTQTIVQEFDQKVDPLTPGGIDPAYFDPLNVRDYTGYFRDEVYRFGMVEVDKFGSASIVKPFNFTNKYVPGTHASTWQYNWAQANGDWRFADRQSYEGSIVQPDGVDENDIKLRAFGLQIEFTQGNEVTVSDDTHYIGIVRLPRKKNILGQSLVINGVGVQGVGNYIDQTTADNLSTVSVKDFISSSGAFTYDGSEDTVLPKVLAMGHSKHLTFGYLTGVQNASKRIFYPAWELAQTRGPLDTVDDDTLPMCDVVFMYPLEFLANNDGATVHAIDETSTEISIIDAVMLTGYNAWRESLVWTNPSNANILEGRLDKYSWFFTPAKHKDYYYANSHHTPGELFDDLTGTSGGMRFSESIVPVSQVYEMPAGGEPIILDQSVIQDSRQSHIRKLWNLSALVNKQADDYSELLDTLQKRFPGPIWNNRGLAIVQKPKTADNARRIFDPTGRVYQNYQIGAGAINGALGLFETGPTMSGTSNTVDGVPTDASNMTTFSAQNSVIDPGTGIPMYIANITNGLGDGRYGEIGYNRELYQFTGSGLVVEDVTALATETFSVWGGDCFLCRNTVNIRANAPLKDMIPASDEQDDSSNYKHYLYQGVYGDTTTDPYSDERPRVSAYNVFSEIVDIYVESVVNSNLIARNTDQFPNGGDLVRDADHADLTNFKTFNWPNGRAEENQLFLPPYLYNRAYSAEAGTKTFLYDGQLAELENNLYPERVHFTPARIKGDFELPYSRFLPNDYYDLNGSFGWIYKMGRGRNNTLYAVQERDVAELFLGQTITQDTTGLELNVASGAIIGYARYLANVPGGPGATGIQRTSAAAFSEFGLFFLDEDRERFVHVNGGQMKDISFSAVRDLLKSEILDTEATFPPLVWYDPVRREVGVQRYGALRDNDLNIMTYLPHLGVWQSIKSVPSGDSTVFGAQDIISSNQIGVQGESYQALSRYDAVFADYWRQYKIEGGSDKGTYLGIVSESELEVILAQPHHRNEPKVLVYVGVDSTTAPTSYRAYVQPKSELAAIQDSGDVTDFRERQNVYITSKFRDLTDGQRIRDANVIVQIKKSGTDAFSVQYIVIGYRADQRTLK